MVSGNTKGLQSGMCMVCGRACAFARLRDISNSLDEIHDMLITLDDTITNKDFAQ